MHDSSLFLQVYQLFRTEGHKSVELHAQHFRQFVTLLLAILTLTLAGVGYLEETGIPPGVILLAGGLLGTTLAICGRLMCDRFYEGMLEAVTVSAKFESLLQIEDRPQSPSSPFPDDKGLLPARWLRNRAKYASSEEFIRVSMGRGSNRVARWTFLAFALINIAVLLMSYRLYESAG